MTKRMLIDATHEEETRVAVVDGTRLMEFDYESKVRKQIKGTIFLAKVTRVEPSLQAAFVNFGGNRHGFLPFAEIHPDYYRIPIADREALIAEQRAEMEAREAEDRAMEEAEERAAAERGEGVAGESEDDSDDEEDVVEEIGGEKPPIEEMEEDEDAAVEAAADAEDESEEQPVFAEAAPPALTIVPDDAAEEDESEDDSDDEEFEDDSEESEEDEPEIDESQGPGNIALLPGDEPAEEDEVNGNTEAGHRGERLSGEGDRNRGDRSRGRGGRNRGGRSGGGGGGNFRGGRSGGRHSAASSRRVEVLGGDGLEGDRPVRPTSRRHYKIQEVIKRGQIMLVQASKEERGNKGAAVTTYLSLPGRYCVLMPNSPRGGGVSRKIANFAERKRMREILSELNVPEGMSVIMRTAGMSRTKVEIKRDCDYLLRLWDEIRDLTLKSTAPALIHEEGKLIRRAVRDLYSRDIEEIIVSGEEGYKSARDFMKVMMPSHSKRVVQYKDEQIPLFHRYQVESQIREMGEPNVTLRSGGYLVINPTEALISVDVNSGRATRERHIEETALKTNMEAAEEVARQLRLRDLGGLVVIDFIDMEDRRNNAKVERKLKESLSTDRARIQMGRISSFGLMEMSRQRLNPSLTEAQFEKCKLCQGIGHTRTVDNAAILAMRGLEEEGVRARGATVQFSMPNEVAIYLLNHKRAMLADIERRYEFHVMVRIDDTLLPGQFKIERMRVEIDADDDEDGDAKPARPERSEENRPPRDSNRDNNRDGHRGRDRDRGHDRNDRSRSRFSRPENQPEARDSEQPDVEAVEGGEAASTDNRPPRDDSNGDRSRRRGRRGGRGRGGERSHNGEGRQPHADGNRAPREDSAAEGSGDETQTPRPRHSNRDEGRRPRREGQDRPRESAAAAQGTAAPAEQPRSSSGVEPKFYGRRPREEGAESSDSAANDARGNVAESKPYDVVSEPAGQKKKGWWNRLVE
ncbi:MAG: Rne/Rng family ribonuclease [Micavibrio sp.]